MVFWCEMCDLLCSHSNGDIFTCEDNMLFSHVKISNFHAKAHLVFHWCLYNKDYLCHLKPLKNVRKNAIYFKLFWPVQNFCPLQIKITQCTVGFRYNILFLTVLFADKAHITSMTVL